MVSSLERVAVEKQNIEILVQIGAGRETECVNPPSRGFRGGLNVNKSWSYGDGVARKVCTDRERQSPRIRHIELLCQQIRRDLVSKPRRNSRFRQDSLTDQQDLGCGLIGSCFRARARPNMDESSCVLSVSILYPAGARWLSLRGESARIQASLRAYPGGFPWVEPVVFKTSGGFMMCAKSRGIELVRMLVALELYEIPREEVAGGAVGVVRGGFPRGGAQRPSNIFQGNYIRNLTQDNSSKWGLRHVVEVWLNCVTAKRKATPSVEVLTFESIWLAPETMAAARSGTNVPIRRAKCTIVLWVLVRFPSDLVQMKAGTKPHQDIMWKPNTITTDFHLPLLPHLRFEMPQVNATWKPGWDAELEEKYTKGCRILNAMPKPNVAAVNCQLGIPYDTLRNHFRGLKHPRIKVHVTQMWLSPPQKEALC
ncbi:hypothetical protein DFH09DRAFT_1100261 [Mycena vulgaris]|nr:hypothetical protein DFH09DRAFT_1100261 [Mycena vulgaris]